jgi:DNA polymerase I
MVIKTTKPLILVDGSSYLYRAFHALPSLANSKNFPTGAIYGVVNMLRKLISDYQPEYMAVVFDAKGKTFRNELYELYKAHRPVMPDELIQQIEPLLKIIRAQGLPLIMIEGVEADDVIGTLALQVTQHNIDVLISTGDKDLAQLVNDHVTLINTMTGTFYNPKTVEEKFGISPAHIIDYLALIGDTSDNIPGVPQVGPKTAVKWLQEYGSLDNIIKNALQIKGKVGENLRASLSQIPLAKTLATIKCNVDLDFSLKNLKREAPDKQTLLHTFQELEFKNWLGDLLEEDKTFQQKKYIQYEMITTLDRLDQWIKQLSEAELIAFDTETTSLNTMNACLVGVSFAIEKGQAAYVPFGHDYMGAPLQLTENQVLEKLKPLLENKHLKKVGHNLKYDTEVLANYDIVLKGIAFDTMLESYIYDSTSNRHDMNSLALKYLSWRTIHFEDIAGKGAKQLTFNQVPLDQASNYAAEDADVTLQLHHTLWPKIEALPGFKHIFEKIEMPLVPILARMERTGVLIDATLLAKQTHELEEKLITLEKNAFHLANTEFNLNSPKQLQEILFQQLKLPIIQKTPTGQASTADAVLQELALDYQLPNIIIEYRSLSKLISTYTSRLPEQINLKTQRVHTSYNQTGATTGRLSSSDPNLQNIPVRTAEGRRIRQAFIAPPRHRIVCADYSQIELRIMAHISNDPNLIKAFENNLDIHKATAAEVFAIPLEQVTDEQRRNAKAINFGLIYGMSAFGLAKQLGIDRHAAQHYIDLYFTRYPNIREYMEKTRRQVATQGYVETLWGRRLNLPDIHSSQVMRQKAAERAAINAPLQGSAADIIKMAMINIDDWIQSHQPDIKMIMQVHDELVFEVSEDWVEKALVMIEDKMTKVVTLKVPLLVSIGVGHNWDEAAG